MNDSPAKKLDFEAVGKENIVQEVFIANSKDSKSPILDEIKTEEKPAPVVAPTIKAEEANEPLLQENPHRFVLFPIKYHEVCRFLRVTR